ncbi:MAG: hypothetical protein KUG50_01155 [Cycloclasticus sp.]|nr:hypothetical protein [Cycloclasticus sp.]
MSAAKQQAEPQRLLFVFLRASLPKDFNSEEEANFHSGNGGELQPIMCTDKVLDELGTFADLVEESKKMEQDWQIVLVASLSGRNGVAPDSAEAEKPLKMMVETVQTGGDLSRYLAFGRDGIPIQFG